MPNPFIAELTENIVADPEAGISEEMEPEWI